MKQTQDDNFESAFKKAFDESSLPPPNSVWESIEKSLPSNNIGSNTAEGGFSASKILIGTSIILITSISIYKLFNSSTNITDNHEKLTTKSIQPKTVESVPSKQILVDRTPINTQKPLKPAIEKVVLKPQMPIIVDELKAKNEAVPEVNNAEEKPENVEIIEKNNLILTEVASKKISNPNQKMLLPNLMLPNDSQNVNMYYDPNLLPTINKPKGKFWENFKVRGSIGVSGGINTNGNSAANPK
jgi:hypothetical protein